MSYLRVDPNWPWPYRPPDWPSAYYGPNGCVVLLQCFLPEGVKICWRPYGETNHTWVNAAVDHAIIDNDPIDFVAGREFEVDACRWDASPPPGAESGLFREVRRFDRVSRVPVPPPPVLPVSASPTITIHARANLPHPVRVTTGDREGWTAHIDPLLRRDNLVLRPGDTVTMDRVQFEHCSGLADLRSRGYIYEV